MRERAQQQPITEAVVAAIAKAADADARSVLRRLAGLPVRGRVGLRIDEAIARTRNKRPGKS